MVSNIFTTQCDCMSIVTYFIATCLREFWCQLPDDGKIIAQKNIEIM